VSALSGPLNITYIDELLADIRAEHGSTPPYDFTYSGNITKLIYSMAGAFSPKLNATPPILFPLNSAGIADKPVLDIWEKHNPSNLIREWKGNPAMAIHTYCGELDEFKLAKPNKMFSDSLDKYKLPHTYIQDPNGDHSNSLFTSFPQGLNFLYNVMDTSQIKIATWAHQNISANNYSIYPNPASDRFFLSGTSNDLIQIDIFNLWGQKIMQIEDPIIERGIDISSFEKGVYLVSLKFTKGVSTGLKLIKR
jgi:hypothetical protein